MIDFHQISTEAEQKNRNSLNLNHVATNDNIVVIHQKGADFDLIHTIIGLTEAHPTIESWNSIKCALDDYDTELFTEFDALTLIKNANNIFPNPDQTLQFKILSVVSFCVNNILDEPSKSLIQYDFFFELFQKLIKYLAAISAAINSTASNDLRCILASNDIIQILAEEYNPNDGNDIITSCFIQAQASFVNILASKIPNEILHIRILETLDKLIKFVQEDNAQAFFHLFYSYIYFGETTTDKAIGALYRLLVAFPSLYQLIVSDVQILQNLVSFVNVNKDSLNSVMYSTKILLPLLSGQYPEIVNVLLSFDIVPELLKSCMVSSYNIPHVIQIICAICENSKEGCDRFIQHGLLSQPALCSFSAKTSLAMLKIIYSAMKFNVLPATPQTVSICELIVEQSLACDEEIMLLIAMKIVQLFHTQGVNFDVNEQIENLVVGDNGDEVARAAQAVLNIISQ